jgi:hypothetical protein
VGSTLLRQLMAAAGDLRVAGAARDMLERLDEDAAAANDLLSLFRQARSCSCCRLCWPACCAEDTPPPPAGVAAACRGEPFLACPAVAIAAWLEPAGSAEQASSPQAAYPSGLLPSLQEAVLPAVWAAAAALEHTPARRAPLVRSRLPALPAPLQAGPTPAAFPFTCYARSAALRDSRREADPPPFPTVSRWRGEVAASEARLQALLPALARQLNVRSVAYVSLQNQGDYLVEVPVELAGRVPKVGGVPGMCGLRMYVRN